MRLVWMPDALCQNYTMGQSYGKKCPYCPYSFDKESNRLLFDNQLSVLNDKLPGSVVTKWLMANKLALRGKVSLTGGEPLLYDELPQVLSDTDFTWDITSNSLRMAVIERMPFARCQCWTASYHPLADRDKQFAEAIRFLKSKKLNLAITVVYSDATKDVIPQAMEFVKGLGVKHIQFHIDAHRVAEHLREDAKKYGIRLVAGEPKSDVVCRKHAMLMALGPDGTLYECVTKMYQNMDPVGNIRDGIQLDALPPRDEFCAVPCFAPCDHVKHA